jgi:hypothetical protein
VKKKLLYTFLIAAICIANSCFCQRNDAGLWLSLELEKLLTKRLSLEFSHTERIAQNITRWDLAYSDIGLSYKFGKHISASANYRYINKFNPEQGVENRHRFYCDLVLKQKLKPFEFSLRQRFQNQLEDMLTSEDGLVPQYYTRSKLAIKYDLKRFTPCIASELYIKLVPGDQPLPNRYRLFGGLNYSINKTNDIEVYYLFDRRFNQKDPLTNYVIGLNYKHTFY